MRIGIDACTWANRGGYGRFTRQLVAAMVREYPQHQFVLVVDQRTAAEGEFPETALLEVVSTSEQPTQAASADGSRGILDLWRMGSAVARARFDAFFFPTRYSYFPFSGTAPTVISAGDRIRRRPPPDLRSVRVSGR